MIVGVLELEYVRAHGEQPMLVANDAPELTETVCTVTACAVLEGVGGGVRGEVTHSADPRTALTLAARAA